MLKQASILLFCFIATVSVIMAYPLYSAVKTVYGTTPPQFHEYTVIDLKSGKRMIVVGDNSIHVYHADDTAWCDNRILYQNASSIHENAMPVVVIASYNQLYQ